MFKAVKVGGFVVGDAIASAHEHAPKAFGVEGQSAHRGGMSFAPLELILDKHFGPTAVESRLAGV